MNFSAMECRSSSRGAPVSSPRSIASSTSAMSRANLYVATNSPSSKIRCTCCRKSSWPRSPGGAVIRPCRSDSQSRFSPNLHGPELLHGMQELSGDRDQLREEALVHLQSALVFRLVAAVVAQRKDAPLRVGYSQRMR